MLLNYARQWRFPRHCFFNPLRWAKGGTAERGGVVVAQSASGLGRDGATRRRTHTPPSSTGHPFPVERGMIPFFLRRGGAERRRGSFAHNPSVMDPYPTVFNGPPQSFARPSHKCAATARKFVVVRTSLTFVLAYKFSKGKGIAHTPRRFRRTPFRGKGEFPFAGEGGDRGTRWGSGKKRLKNIFCLI